MEISFRTWNLRFSGVQLLLRTWNFRFACVQVLRAREIFVVQVYRWFARVKFRFAREFAFCGVGVRLAGKKIGGRGRFGVYRLSSRGLPHTSPPLTSLTESHSFGLPERISHHESQRKT